MRRSPAENHRLFPAAGQYITTRDVFSFAVKAVHNEEPHNYNDIGSFILSTKNGQEICDLGAGLYTRQYFGPERYTIFCNTSASHSVPIVNGLLQHEGRAYAGTMQTEGDTVMLEIGGAYPDDVGSSTRRFVVGDSRVCLCDTWTDKVTNLTERFVSLTEPTVTEGAVTFLDCVLYFEADTAQPTVTVESHVDHFGKTILVYCVDFAVDPSKKSIAFTFAIR